MKNVTAALSASGAYLAGEYDIIVIGTGHAGCEAALASARLGRQTLILGMNLDTVANMPCNPNIGGTAKGQLVREIDALGGEMGRAADRAMIQFRMLNASRGPAVLSPRAQIDRRLYQQIMKETLEKTDRLDVRQGEVIELLVDADGHELRIEGVRLRTEAIYRCKSVILATGTFLESRIIIGDCQYSGGPDSQFAAHGLSESLRDLGLLLQRFKTGTPARINRRSVDFTPMEQQDGDPIPFAFSYENEENPPINPDEQIPCYLTWTTPQTRAVIEQNLDRSPLLSGVIEGVGPRYCPSIEDKYVKFPDKERHQIFLEPMGRNTEEMYLQGLSSSMPEDVQLIMVRSLPGLQSARIMRSAYAIEYDCLDPRLLQMSLEVRGITGLFSAGQINGTSGYEEAAGQGLIAGINAVRKLNDKEPVILDRSQAYIGVLIDYLITKGTTEPYRMMTARAEYRLVLRQDNADARLTPIGRSVGLIDQARWDHFQIKQERIQTEIERCRNIRIRPSAESDAVMRSLGTVPLRQPASLADLLKRPEIHYEDLEVLDPDRPSLSRVEQTAVEVSIKYEGYIRLEEERIGQFRKLERKSIPDSIDYRLIKGLRIEAQQKLSRQRPISIGQAKRISGVSPADLAVLLIYLQSLKRDDEEGKRG